MYKDFSKSAFSSAAKYTKMFIADFQMEEILSTSMSRNRDLVVQNLRKFTIDGLFVNTLIFCVTTNCPFFWVKCRVC